MLRLIAALALFSAAGPAQILNTVIHPKVYTYYKTTNLSGSAETITVQQPATGAKRVLMRSFTVCQDTAVTWTLSINGTAATTTGDTEIQLTDGGAPKATVFHTSNVGAGTTIMAYPLAADECRTIDVSNIHLIGNGTTNNVSIGSDSVTGNVYVNVVWEERAR